MRGYAVGVRCITTDSIVQRDEDGMEECKCDCVAVRMAKQLNVGSRDEEARRDRGRGREGRGEGGEGREGKDVRWMYLQT